jgi:hypothetical protein
MIQIKTEKPIAVYNVQIPECICIFKSRKALAKYLKTGNSTISSMYDKIQKIANRTDNNKYCENNILGKTLTFRYANEEQLKLLGDNKFILLVDYIPVPVATIFLHT